MRFCLMMAGFGAVALGAITCSSNRSDSNGTGGGTGEGGTGTITVTGGTGGAAAASECQTFSGKDLTCGTTSSVAKLKKVNTLLVVDKSRSMSEVPTGFTQNKWIALTQALNQVLNDTKDLMAYGLELFPEKSVTADCTDTCCNMPAAGTVNVAVGSPIGDITDELGATVPGGGTPTAEALRGALEYFKNGPGAGLAGDKIVFLATDGGPNCNGTLTGTPPCILSQCTLNIDGVPDVCRNTTTNCCDPVAHGQVTGCLDTVAVIQAIQALGAAGIKTVVLGIPGTEQYTTVLDQMAQYGGLPDPNSATTGHLFYAANAADGVAGLTNSIEQITTQLINKCTIQLEQPLPDPDKVQVALDCNLLNGPNSDAAAPDWTLDRSTTPETVVLTGATCDYVQSHGAQRIDIVLGCVEGAR